MPAPTYLSPPSLPLHHAATSAHFLSGGRNRRSRPRHMSGLVLLKAKVGDGDGDGGDELLLASRRHTVLGVARVLFAAANERCLRGMNQAALGRGNFFVGAMANSWRVLMQGLASLMFLCARVDEYVRQPPSPLVLTPHDKPAAHPQQEDDSVDKKRKLDLTGFNDPYDPSYGDDEVYEYDSGEDVDHSNVESFIVKEVQKIKDKGSAAYYKRNKFQCPYCTKPKPKDGLFEHLLSHARDASRSGEDQKIRAQHAALLKALSPM